MENFHEQVKQMVEKAAKTDKSGEALQFSQAALNAAHAAQVMVQTANSTNKN